MRVFIIAFGLFELYTLAAPSGQSVTTNLIAGALCMAVAMAITGKGSKTTSQSAGLTTSLMPSLFLLSGVAALAWGIHLYIAGPQPLNGDEVVSLVDVRLPIMLCIAGAGLILGSVAQIFIRSR